MPCGSVIYSSIMLRYIASVPNSLRTFHLERMLNFYAVNEHSKEEIKKQFHL